MSCNRVLRVRDHDHILVHIVEISQLDAARLHIQTNFLNTITKIFRHIDL